MMYFEDIQNFIRDLCVKHKQLRHGVGGTAFIPMTQSAEPNSYSDLKKIFVKIDEASTSLRESDQVWAIGITCLATVQDGLMNRETEFENASKAAQQILYDFEAYIRNFFEDECSFINRLLDSSMEPVELEGQTEMGWTYVWRFTCFGPDYDQNAWEE